MTMLLETRPLLGLLLALITLSWSCAEAQYIQPLRPIFPQLQPPPPQASSSSPSSAPNNLQAQSQNPYLKATDEILLNMRHQMVTRQLKFDQHFRDLLRDSKVSLHNMFTDAYGMMYQHNTDIFTSMYEELEQYYASGQIKLTLSMNRFFESLYQKIFQVFHTSRSFTPSFLKCATDQLAHLKPFKDIPEKLTDGVRHAFVAARTFVKALDNGVDVIKSIISVGQTAQCSHLINEKLLRNIHGANNINSPPALQTRQPCLGFCEQVITRCFVKEPLAMLNQKWNAYVTSLSELGTKLSTSYNIETIIAPLDVQISEAIMLFQENATNISEHVFQACGMKPNIREDPHSLNPLRQPSNRLSKRAASLGPAAAPVAGRFNQNSMGSYSAGSHRVNSNSDDFSLSGHLRDATRDLSGIPLPYLPPYLTTLGNKSPQLIEEIKNYMLSTRNFWNNLPNEDKFEGFDINTDIRYKTEFDKQLIHLDDMRTKIEGALAGREILWPSESYVQPSVHQTFRPSPAVTTSTSTTPEPSQPDQEEDEDTICDGEDGSGDDCVPTEDDIEVTTDNPEYTDESDISNEDPTSQSSPSYPEVDQVSSTTEIPNNDIDKPQHPNIDESQLHLITAGNLAHSYKSGQMSNKLVITYEARLLIALLSSVSLLIVTNFQRVPQLIA